MNVGSRSHCPRSLGILASCAVFLLLLALGGCSKPAKDWRKQLRSEDPFERLLAALALCEAHPKKSSAAILVLFKAMESDVKRERRAAEHALERMAPHKLPDLAQFLVVAGLDRPIVRTKLQPLLQAGGDGVGPALLDALRDNDWIGPPEARRMLVARARAEPEFVRLIVEELVAPECRDRNHLGDLLFEVGAPAHPPLREAEPVPDSESARAVDSVIDRLSKAGG